MLNMKAKANLKTMEATGQACPRSWNIRADDSGFKRWIHPNHVNKNNCPGCGLNYRRLLESYPGDYRADGFALADNTDPNQTSAKVGTSSLTSTELWPIIPLPDLAHHGARTASPLS